MNKEIMEMAKDLGIKIQKSKEFLDFKLLKEGMDSDEELASIRKEFDSIKNSLNEEISKEDSDRDTIKKLSDELRDAYDKMNSFESVCKYENAKKNLNELVNEVNTVINESAYGKFYQSSFASCNGSCESCEGCH